MNKTISMSIRVSEEELVKREMKIKLGKNDFGYVYVQGEKCAVSAINNALKNAGGKPNVCALTDYTTKGTSKKGAMPEFVITLNVELNTVIVVECKKTFLNMKV